MHSGPAAVPALCGRNLLGRTVHLPADLPSELTLFVAGFTERHQRDIDRWAEALPEVDVLEVVLIPASQEFQRSFIEGGMAMYVRDPDVRARTWCLYGDLAAFLGRLGVADREHVLAVVASPDGALQAMAVGPPTAASVREIRCALERPAVEGAPAADDRGTG